MHMLVPNLPVPLLEKKDTCRARERQEGLCCCRCVCACSGHREARCSCQGSHLGQVTRQCGCHPAFLLARSHVPSADPSELPASGGVLAQTSPREECPDPVSFRHFLCSPGSRAAGRASARNSECSPGFLPGLLSPPCLCSLESLFF